MTGTGRPAGYTLIEVLVVLLILGLIASFAMPPAARIVDGVMLETDARAVAAALRDFRTEAIEGGKIVSLRVRDDGSVGDGAGHQIALPSGGSLHLNVDAVRFYPDGTTTEASVTVSRGSQSLDVDMAWLTGAVSVGVAQ